MSSKTRRRADGLPQIGTLDGAATRDPELYDLMTRGRDELDVCGLEVLHRPELGDVVVFGRRADVQRLLTMWAMPHSALEACKRGRLDRVVAVQVLERHAAAALDHHKIKGASDGLRNQPKTGNATLLVVRQSGMVSIARFEVSP